MQRILLMIALVLVVAFAARPVAAATEVEKAEKAVKKIAVIEGSPPEARRKLCACEQFGLVGRLEYFADTIGALKSFRVICVQVLFSSADGTAITNSSGNRCESFKILP